MEDAVNISVPDPKDFLMDRVPNRLPASVNKNNSPKNNHITLKSSHKGK
jgi:hypothetical protein